MISVEKSRKYAVLLNAGRPTFGFSNLENSLAPVSQTALQSVVNELLSKGFEVFAVQGFSDFSILGANMVTNHDWRQNGPFQSLAMAIDEFGPVWPRDSGPEPVVLAIYGDSLPTSKRLDEFIKGIDPQADAAFARAEGDILQSSIGSGIFLQAVERVTSHWGQSDSHSGPTNGPFWLTGKVVSRLLEINKKECDPTLFMGEVLSQLSREGWKVQGVYEDPSVDAVKLAISAKGLFSFGSKAETLASISQVHRAGLVPKFSFFSRTSWERDAESLLCSVMRRHQSATFLAIRSSFRAEDLAGGGSNAGKFLSVLDVPRDNENSVVEAIERVLGSNPDPSNLDQVLIQEQVLNSKAAGVVTTRNQRGAAYFSVNLSLSEGDTDSVTSGANLSFKEFVCKSDLSMIDWAGTPEFMQEICLLAEETGALTAHDALDLEFAIDSSGQIKLLQVRRFNAPIMSSEEIALQRQQVSSASLTFSRNDQCLCPESMHDLFALMPDWNPAEIIGKKPRKLARSLYGHIITDHVWSDQRAEYGYHRVNHALLRDFLGTPAVDVHSSFLSLVPESIAEPLAIRIVSSAKENLREKPALHDKVEFDVMPTCFDSNFDRWRQGTLRSEKFTDCEFLIIKQAYFNLTREAILRRLGFGAEDKASVSECRAPDGTVESVLENLKNARAGALTFAHYARDAFVAISLLTGNAVGGANLKRVERFVGTLSTVSAQFVDDCHMASEGKLELGELISKYGHLRSGTYDILNPTFQSHPKFFFSASTSLEATHRHESNEVAMEIATSIARELQLEGMSFDASEMQMFLKSAIEGRESSKLAFTRHLSRAIDGIEEWGARNGISKDELSHLPLETLRQVLLYDQLSPESRIDLLEQSSINAQLHKLYSSLEVPLIISSGQDLLRYQEIAIAPNFSGSKSVFAPKIVLTGHELLEGETIEGKIVLVEAADPGFDWIFSKAPAGLVTLFGGRNSHMAIRCMELDLPAAIGVGESHFEKLSRQETIFLDPLSKRIS